MSDPPELLEAADYGGKGGQLLRVGFKGARRVTQGDPLSPTIFNVVVDAVVQHWVQVMGEGVEEQGERGKEDRHHNDLFYADDGIVAL